MSQTPRSNPEQKPLKPLAWWLVFALATYIMSLWFQTFRVFTLSPTLHNGLIWVGVMLLLVLTVAVLVYDIYIQEKSRGHIAKPVPLFDWMAEKRFLLKSNLHDKGDIK